ncbi:MAG: TolC family protein [Deltaproteobacteria bacterium]|nr:TolC family protein [Deltaproteobacteria bacterium]
MRTWIFAALAWLCPALAAAQTLNEAQAVAKALHRAPEVAAAEHARAIARRGALVAVGQPQPMVRVTVSQIGIPPMEPPAAWVMVDQPLVLGTQLRDQRDAALAAADVGAQDARVAAGETAFAVRQAFARWRGLHRQLDLLQHHHGMAQGIEKTLVAALSAGKDVSASRLAQAQADIAQLEAQRLAVAAALPGALAELEAWMGEPVRDKPAADLPEAPSPVSLDDHPAVARLAAQGVAAARLAQAERSADAWTVTPSAGLMTMPGMPVGLMLSVGVRPGAWTEAEKQRLQGRAATALDSRQTQQSLAQAVRRRLKARLAAADGALLQLGVQVQALRDRVLPAQRRAVTAAMPALAAGSRSVADVLEAQHRLVALDLQIADLETQWLTQRAARIRLETADSDGMPSMGGAGAAGMDDGDAGMPMSRSGGMK